MKLGNLSFQASDAARRNLSHQCLTKLFEKKSWFEPCPEIGVFQAQQNTAEVLDLPTLAEDVDLTVGSKLLETILQILAGRNPPPGLLERLSRFAVTLGKRHKQNGAVEKAIEAFRRSRELSHIQEARGLLADVLLESHGKGCAVDSCEVLRLLAEEGRWETIVEKWTSLEGSAEKTAIWPSQHVERLASEFQKAKDPTTAAGLYIQQGRTKEAAGGKEEAFQAFRKAYKMGDDVAKSAESGLHRLAVEVGCVKDAAADLLSPLLGGTDEAQERVYKVVEMLEKYVDKCRSSGSSGPPEAAAPSRTAVTAATPAPRAEPECPRATPLFASFFESGESQDSDCIMVPPIAPLTPATPISAPATPASSVPATPTLWQASNWTQKAPDLQTL